MIISALYYMLVAIRCRSHGLEPDEEQEMAGGDPLSHRPAAVFLEIVPPEIEVTEAMKVEQCSVKSLFVHLACCSHGRCRYRVSTKPPSRRTRRPGTGSDRRQKTQSITLTDIKGTINDANVYVLEGEEPGGTVLILGGTHPEEPAGRLTTWIFTENAVD